MRCDAKSLTRDKDDPECATEEEIDNYVDDLELEIVVVNKQLDTNKKDGEEPTFTTQSTLGSTLLSVDKAITYNLYLAYNHMEAIDSLIQIGQSQVFSFLNYKNIRSK